MSKEYSIYLKGVAILLMVFLHLFQDLQWDMSLKCLFTIGEIPLVYYISRMCNPVPFFLILSGYGLYATYKKIDGVRPWKRVANLYIHLWLIYFLLLPLACYVKPNMYPGSVILFLKNATSWQCSYIGEQWFLLPYIIMMIVAPFIFHMLDRIRGRFIFVLVIVIWAGTCIPLKFLGHEVMAKNMLFYNIFLAIYLLPSFMLGYMANRFEFFKKVHSVFLRFGKLSNRIPLIILPLFCIVYCFNTISVLAPFFAFCFILLFVQIPIGERIGSILSYLGKHSMNIWLIHTWFSTRLFHDFFFNELQYPVLIYVTLFALSLLVSHLVEWLYKPFSFIVSRINA